MTRDCGHIWCTTSPTRCVLCDEPLVPWWRRMQWKAEILLAELRGEVAARVRKEHADD